MCFTSDTHGKSNLFSPTALPFLANACQYNGVTTSEHAATTTLSKYFEAILTLRLHSPDKSSLAALDVSSKLKVAAKVLLS